MASTIAGRVTLSCFVPAAPAKSKVISSAERHDAASGPAATNAHRAEIKNVAASNSDRLLI